MTPLFLHYPEDLNTFKIQYEFLYGSDLLVAPVLEPSTVIWEVYLPSGRWIHFWDDDQQVFEGPTSITINATLGKTPVFFRSDSKWAPLFSDIRNRFNI
jgi:alpha-glucosidase